MVYSQERISKALKAVKSKNTTPEVLLRKALINSGVRGYRLYWHKVVGIPDIAFPSKKIAIFIHGCFWHRCPYCKPKIPQTNSDFWIEKFNRNQIRDNLVSSELKKQGWVVIIIWECQVKKNIDYCVKIVKDALKRWANNE